MKRGDNQTKICAGEQAASKLNRQLGTHFIVELIDCQPDILAKADLLRKVMLEVAEESKSHTIGSCFHQFEPHGATGVLLLKESHFSVHTWPEEGYAAADIFTCGSEMDPFIAIRVMQEKFVAQEIRYQEISRGV